MYGVERVEVQLRAPARRLAQLIANPPVLQDGEALDGDWGHSPVGRRGAEGRHSRGRGGLVALDDDRIATAALAIQTHLGAWGQEQSEADLQPLAAGATGLWILVFGRAD